jgi:hypothetical protein
MSLRGQASWEKWHHPGVQQHDSRTKINKTEELTYLSINSATPLKGFIVQVSTFLVALQSLTMISVQQGVSRCLRNKNFYDSKYYNRMICWCIRHCQTLTT